MNNKMRWTTISLGVLLCTGLVGCGKGLQSSGSNGPQSVQSVTDNVNQQLNQAAKDAQSASTALQNVNTAIGQISDAQGNINIGMFIPGVSNPVDQVVAQIQGYFDQFYVKAQAVKSTLDSAKAQLAAAIAKLDPNNPAQEIEIQQLTAEMTQVDSLDQKFSSSMHLLASKLSLAITSLDNLISGVTTSVPTWGPIIGLVIDWTVMDSVRGLFQNMEGKLNSL